MRRFGKQRGTRRLANRVRQSRLASWDVHLHIPCFRGVMVRHLAPRAGHPTHPTDLLVFSMGGRTRDRPTRHPMAVGLGSALPMAFPLSFECLGGIPTVNHKSSHGTLHQNMEGRQTSFSPNPLIAHPSSSRDALCASSGRTMFGFRPSKMFQLREAIDPAAGAFSSTAFGCPKLCVWKRRSWVRPKATVIDGECPKGERH